MSKRINGERLVAWHKAIRERLRRREMVVSMSMEHQPPSLIRKQTGLTRGQVAGILTRWGDELTCPKPRINLGGRPRKVADDSKVEHKKAISRLRSEAISASPVTGTSFDRITMAEMTPTMCRYPHGDPKDWENFSFCGKPVADVGPYCPEHRDLCTFTKLLGGANHECS